MTKLELITKTVQELFDEELLNLSDTSDVDALKADVTEIIHRHLEDFTLVYSNGIVTE